VEQGRLVRVLPDWEPDPVELHAVYPSRLASSPNVRVFLQFLREHSVGAPIDKACREADLQRVISTPRTVGELSPVRSL
jgi:hypothetical protein